MTPKHEGWCSVEEYEKWTAETEEHDRKITEQVLRQIEARRRLKAIEEIGNYLRVAWWIAERAVIGLIAIGIGFFIWELIDALPRFIEAWR